MQRRRAAGLLAALLAASGSCSRHTPAAATEIHLVVTGGPIAGSYDVTSSEVTCSRDLVGPDSWGNQYTDFGLSSRLRNLQVVVPSVREAEKGSERFYLGLTFGSFTEGVMYEIETRPGAARQSGEGRVEFEDHDSTSTVTLNGKVGDSVAVSATIQCHRERRPEPITTNAR